MNQVDLGPAALAGIAAASLLAAAAALLALRRWSDQEAIARARARAFARLLELRLFLDEPRQVLRAQGALLADNLRIFRLLLPPLLVLAVPMWLALWQLDAFYGRAPLPVGQAAVVTSLARPAAIGAPPAVTVETPPVYLASAGETCWRVRPTRPASGLIRIAGASTRLVAGPGIAYLPEPLFGRPAIEISYPPATVFGLHWLTWFLILSTVAAFLLRRPLRVRF